MQKMIATNLNVQQLKTQAKDLRVEEKVLLSGTVYAVFDQAYRRLYDLIQEGKPLPIDLDGAVIYYTSPSPTPKGKVIGSCGPTTAARLDRYTPSLMDLGVVGTIGKGERSTEVYEAICRNHAVYLCALGGAGALLSSYVEECEDVAFLEFGSDCIKKLILRDFPLVVAADCTGRTIFDIGKFKYRRL